MVSCSETAALRQTDRDLVEVMQLVINSLIEGGCGHYWNVMLKVCIDLMVIVHVYP